MKASFILALFVAAAAAAPASDAADASKPPPAGLKRCGKKIGRYCRSGEVCVGERNIKGGVGLCVSGAFENQCANFLGSVCRGNDFCIEDPRNLVDCKPGMMDCGNGLCVRSDWAKYLDLKYPN
ncbi:hypothetical protein TWF481_003650 [Arthrobotrys musiformis]|uniref:Uncharacterized protein n=1 Tax=Arthrobotrys musiformis TaxID=47236 RepID=A0AAV9WHC4_9PEZI